MPQSQLKATSESDEQVLDFDDPTLKGENTYNVVNRWVFKERGFKISWHKKRVKKESWPYPLSLDVLAIPSVHVIVSYNSQLILLKI